MMSYRTSPLTKPRLECYPIPLSGNDFQRYDSSDDIDSDDFYGDGSIRHRFFLINKLNASLQNSVNTEPNRNSTVNAAIRPQSSPSSGASRHCIKCTTAQNGIRKCQSGQHPQHHHRPVHLHESPKFGYFVPIAMGPNQQSEQRGQSQPPFDNDHKQTVKTRHRRRTTRR